jgi:hypothetical protein
MVGCYGLILDDALHFSPFDVATGPPRLIGEPWTIDVDDRFSATDPYEDVSALALGFDNLRAMDNLPAKKGVIAGSHQETFFTGGAPIHADFTGEHVHYAVVVLVVMPLAWLVIGGDQALTNL